MVKSFFTYNNYFKTHFILLILKTIYVNMLYL